MKVAIICPDNFEQLYMIKNYIVKLEHLYRPFAGFDPEYDEEITLISKCGSLADAVGLTKGSLEGFKTEHIGTDELAIATADRVVIFTNVKEVDNIREVLDYALTQGKHIEVLQAEE